MEGLFLLLDRKVAVSPGAKPRRRGSIATLLGEQAVRTVYVDGGSKQTRNLSREEGAGGDRLLGTISVK